MSMDPNFVLLSLALIFGLYMARGIGALNLGVIRTILMSWIITLPAGAALAVIFYYLLRLILT